MKSVFNNIAFEFDKLPLLVEGESKIVRLLTPEIVVERFKPTIYSFTHNRYGEAPGTDISRALFSAEIFRRMALLKEKTFVPKSAFLGVVESPEGPLLVQKRVEPSNLEVRVKRYHIGSPFHRYRYTEHYPTTQRCGALKRWSRFDQPIVCFDWRHPITDNQGKRLADEPISDDYAAVWMQNIPHAREMARSTFLWLEELFINAGFILVDICFFIDFTGRFLYGEISPDCMRVRRLSNDSDLENAESLDKDLWRHGATAEEVQFWYRHLYEQLFMNSEQNVAAS